MGATGMKRRYAVWGKIVLWMILIDFQESCNWFCRYERYIYFMQISMYMSEKGELLLMRCYVSEVPMWSSSLIAAGQMKFLSNIPWNEIAQNFTSLSLDSLLNRLLHILFIYLYRFREDINPTRFKVQHNMALSISTSWWFQLRTARSSWTSNTWYHANQ